LNLGDAKLDSSMSKKIADHDKSNQEKLEDNMSLSEIIERRFGKFKKVTEVRTQ